MSKFLLNKPVLIEKHENYQKQSYRNRCYIYGANGKQCLVIPVKKLHGEKTPITKVEIDYAMNWPKNHLKAFESAYRLSAFYEYYADEFNAFYNRKTRLLFDWNLNLTGFVLNLLGITSRPTLTDAFVTDPGNCTDLRNSIHPKPRLIRPDPGFTPVPYQQVFGERYGFLPNLSIIDLLFNEGPMAREILKSSVM